MMTRRMLYIGEDEAIGPMTRHLVDVEEHGPKLRYVIHVRVSDISPARVLSYFSWDGLGKDWKDA